MKERRALSFLTVLLICMVGFCGCKSTKEKKVTKDKDGNVIIKVKSETITKDKKWKSIITNTKNGKNLSPQLSWEPVDKAKYYAIYMVDTSANNWMHWEVKDYKKTEMKLGEKISKSRYVGPYPPSGIHTYVVKVYALKEKPDEYKGYFDSDNPKYEKVEDALDTISGKKGNIIGYGDISGTYKTGTTVK